MDLYGRDPERAAVDGLLAQARRARSGVLVLRGEPGMGKSALLSYASHRGPGALVLRVAGVQPEIDLPYAALQRFLQPALPLLDRIPDVQAAALQGGLALAPGDGGNRFAIALAVLSLLSEAAADGPVLCLVDDAQWLDHPSAGALTFAGRRIKAEGIAMLFALREADAGTFPGHGLPSLTLEGLDHDSADRLLAERFGTRIAPDVRRVVRDAALGNPLALLEIPRMLSAQQLAGNEALPAPMPLGSELERILLDQVGELSPDVRSLLLVTAAEGSGDVEVIVEAGGRLGIPGGALSAAVASGMVRTQGGMLVFRHPILRTAVYQGAAPAQRRAAHQALADVLTGDRDSDRRAWHRAALAGRHDDAVAAELEETAGRARRRGGHAAAATALHRAADLSSGAADRARRLTGAARAAWDAGRPDETRALLRLVETPADRSTYADLRHLEGELEMRCGLPAEGAKLLLDGARQVSGHDPPKALRMLLDAAISAIYAGDHTAMTEAVRHARQLSADRLGAVAPLVDVLEAVTGMMVRRPGGPDRLVQWLDRVSASDDPLMLVWAGGAAGGIGDPVRRERLRRRAEVLARRSTAVGTLVMVLERIAWMEMLTGQVTTAAMHAREGLELADEAALTNSACLHRAILSWAAAVRGDEATCRSLAGEASVTALANGLGPHHSIALWAVGLLDLGQARWDPATVRLSSMSAPGTGHPHVTLMALPDLVEAAARAGRPDLAVPAADRYAEYVGGSGPAWQQALVLRCRALLGPDDDRGRLLTEAMELHRADDRPFAEARTRLLLGEHLRRRRRRGEARPCLAAAAETFEALGAAPWAARARAELRATGETARRRAPRTLADLTPQQAQIARMVAGGATNKEIAAQLFLSPRTVDYHLRNVFVTLGITSRADLIRLRLGGGETPAGGLPDDPLPER